MLSVFALDSQVIQEGLCTGCGACQGLCPYWDSVQGRTIAYFDCARTDGRCQRFCPRMPTDIAELRKQAFGQEKVLDGIGPFRSLLLARAADPQIRAGAQHGGVVTALCELALKEGLIDAAALTHAHGALDPEGMLVTDPEKVRECSGSSYQIPPTLAVVNRALKEEKYKKIGIVGTPCKTLAAYKMMYGTPPEGYEPVRGISLVIGLFCGWGLDWDGLRELAERHADTGSIRHMDIPPSKYHCLQITADSGTVSVNLDEVLPIVREACHYCADMSCEFADLSVGGARSEDGWDVDKKWNQIVVRSRKGEELIGLAREKGILEFKDVPDGAIEKLKNACLGKRRKAISHLHEKYGADNLGLTLKLPEQYHRLKILS